jgi:rhodanese-related sulfurtransferase
MWLTLTAIGAGALYLIILVRRNRNTDCDEIEQHSITAEELHSMLASNQDVLLLDVRQPLDLLAYPEIIPGAKRIPPNDVLQKPSLIPKETTTVVYCTCPDEKTSRAILRKALAMKFFGIKFLKGGLAAWKSKGYPVEPYKENFSLYPPTLASSAR